MASFSSDNGQEIIGLGEEGFPLAHEVIQGFCPDQSKKQIALTLDRIQAKHHKEFQCDIDFGRQEMMMKRGKPARTVCSSLALKYIVEYTGVQHSHRTLIQSLENQIKVRATIN